MLSPEIARDLQVDRVCTRFEDELKAHRIPRIEVFLQDCTEDMQEEVFRELVALELWYANERQETLAVRDYLERFPEFEDAVWDCFDQALTTSKNSVDSIDLPALFGRYKILKRLGAGGMGNVYLAEDQSLDRQIALKVPRISQSNDSAVLSRFRREAQAAARIIHPHLCPVYDIGEIDGIVYLTMAYIEGLSLAEAIAQQRRMTLHRKVELVRKIAQALSEAHEKGVIHRDLKPSNVMLNARGEPVVVDFGLARTEVDEMTRITTAGALVGTPAYASPEQIESHAEIDSRTDIYSLGVILYELLTNQLPYQSSSPLTLLRKILENDPLPPSSIQPNVPVDLDTICLKAISHRADDRYQTMQEFDEALAQIASHLAPTENDSSTPKPSVSSSTESRVTTSKPAWWISTTSMDGTSRIFNQQILGIAALAIALAIIAWRLKPSHSEVDQHLVSIPGQDIPGADILPDSPHDAGGNSGTEEPPEEEVAEVPQIQIDSKDLRVQLPVPLGGWTKLTGRLWHAPLDRNDALHFKLYMRCVDERDVDGHRCQVLELEVTTLNSNHIEQASLLVDIDAYRELGEFKVQQGWLMAPRDSIFVEYDPSPDKDPLASRYAIEGVDMPSKRLSVQDVLALLYNANVKTTEEMFRKMHLELETERKLKDQELEVLSAEESGAEYTLVRTKESAEELPVAYSLEINLDSQQVPFTWGSVKLNYQQFSRPIFEATLTREVGGLREGENLAELPDPSWTPEVPDPVPYHDFAYVNLPDEAGAWCRFEANLAVPMVGRMQSIKLDRVELRVLNQEMVDGVPYRWIEVDVQTGGSLSPKRIVETVRLLINEQLYREKRKFEFLQDKNNLQHQACARLQVGEDDPMYVRFDPEQDRMKDFHKDQVPMRVPARNVISLLFGAQLKPNLLPFDVREHVAYALTDGLLKRHFIPNKEKGVPQRGDLTCLLVRPGRPVSIDKNANLPTTTLDYNIFISQTPNKHPFRWVNVDLNLFEERNDLLGQRIFGGNLKLRGFGDDAESAIEESMEHIVKELDPGEKDAYQKSKLYFDTARKLVDNRKTDEAIMWYEKFIEFRPDTLAAYDAQQAIDQLKQ